MARNKNGSPINCLCYFKGRLWFRAVGGAAVRFGHEFEGAAGRSRSSHQEHVADACML